MTFIMNLPHGTNYAMIGYFQLWILNQLQFIFLLGLQELSYLKEVLQMKSSFFHKLLQGVIIVTWLQPQHHFPILTLGSVRSWLVFLISLHHLFWFILSIGLLFAVDTHWSLFLDGLIFVESLILHSSYYRVTSNLVKLCFWHSQLTKKLTQYFLTSLSHRALSLTLIRETEET